MKTDQILADLEMQLGTAASAPELLAALKEMHSAFRFYSKGHELNAIQSAHRAIGKAEGRA